MRASCCATVAKTSSESLFSMPRHAIHNGTSKCLRTAAFADRTERPPRYFQPRWVFAGLFLFSLLFFLALLRVPRVDRQLIGSDGAYYYVYVRSLVIDHDLNFANEYAYYRLPAITNGPTS